MSLSAKKVEEGKKDASGLPNRLNQDFVVHNMPSPLSSSATVSGNKITPSGNHKKTGMLIIGGGLLLVAALVYGVYALIIKPSLTPTVNQPVVSNTPNINQPINQVTPADTGTTENQATSVPPIINVSTSTATSTATNTVAAASSTAPSVSTPLDQISFVDMDKDGLSDAEEKLLGSDPTKTDTDGDGNLDLAEVQNGYNPAGAGKLAASPFISSYRNPSLKYAIIYPKAWSLKALNNNETVVVTSADENYFVQIIHQSNTDGSGIAAWYQKEFPDQQAGEGRFAVDGSWSGIFNADKSVFYLTDKGKKDVYIFSLGAASGSPADYFRIFTMIIDNFKLNAK